MPRPTDHQPRSPRWTHTTLHGDVIAEPVLRYLPDDMPYVTFTIDSTDPVPMQAARFEVIAYRRLAENTALTLRPGMTVTITGHLTAGVAGERQLEATDIAVSLGYATAEVTLQERHFHSSDLAGEVTAPAW